jgi:hypothetical protein
MTSRNVVARFRPPTKTRRVGHGGRFVGEVLNEGASDGWWHFEVG